MNQIIEQRIATLIDSLTPNGMATISETRLKTALDQVGQVAYNEGRHDALSSLLTTETAADLLNVSIRRVRALAKTRGVGWQVSRGTWIFRPEDIERLRPGRSGRPNRAR